MTTLATEAGCASKNQPDSQGRQHFDAKSQCAKIAKWLMRGRKLTPIQAFRLFGSLRLGGRIHELRRAGLPIKTRMMRTQSGKRVAQYFLES